MRRGDPARSGCSDAQGTKTGRSRSVNTATALDRLDYEWPAGFARFVLEASNPNVSELPGQQMRALGRMLGCRLRQIWARY